MVDILEFVVAFSVKKQGGVAAPRKFLLQKAQNCFPKIGWGGQRPFGSFPKIHLFCFERPLAKRERRYVSSDDDEQYDN